MDEIPQDVWPLIISHLEDKTKRQMRLASTKWFSLIRYNNFNLYFTKIEDIPTITERLAKYSWPIKLGFNKCKIRDGQELINHLTKLTNLAKLELEKNNYSVQFPHDPSAWMQLSVLTNIEEWDFGNAQVPLKLWSNFRKLTSWQSSKKSRDEQRLHRVLQRMTNLNSLSIINSPMTIWPFTLLKYPERLTSLTLGHEMRYKEDLALGLPSVWSRLANLKSLNIINNPWSDCIPDLIYLTALEMADFNCITVPNLYANTKLTQLRLNCQIWSKDNSMALTNLKCLERVSIHVPDLTDNYSHFEFLLHLPSLNSLCFTSDHNRPLDEVYQYLPTTLTELVWTLSVDVAELAHLTSLMHLVLTRPALNFPYLEKLSHLTCLSLELWDPDSDLRSISSLTNLRRLDLEKLEYNDVIFFEFNLNFELDLTPLVNLQQLTWDIGDWPQRDKTLSKLTNLEKLAIFGPKSSKPLQGIEYLSKLTKLRATTGSNSPYDPSFWNSLTRLTALEGIIINNLTDEVISHMTALKRLTWLSSVDSEEPHPDQGLKGHNLTALTTLQRLRLINMPDSMIYTEQELMAKLPYLYNCRILFLPQAADLMAMDEDEF